MERSLKDAFHKRFHKVDDASRELAEVYLKRRKEVDMERVLATLLGHEKQKSLKEKKGAEYIEKAPEELSDLPDSIADHTKSLVMRGKEYPVAEPYRLTLTDLKKLVAFCEEHGYECEVAGDSIHFPGNTLRILFREKG